MEDLSGKTIEELRAINKAGEEALLELNRRHALESEAVKKRVIEGPPFKAEELEFAKETRCPCGLLLAYPKHIGPHGCWDCSGILMDSVPHKGEEGSVTHTGRLPFAFWKVK